MFSIKIKLTWLLIILFSSACEKYPKLPKPTQATGKITILDTLGQERKTGWWPRVQFDKNERPHLAYCDVYHGNLMYAKRKNDGTWMTKPLVTDGAVGKYISLSIDPNNRAALLYYDQTMKYLKYSHQIKDEVWKHENVAWGIEAGMGNTLLFNPQKEPVAFYYLPSGKFVYATRQANGTWSKRILMESTGSYYVKTSALFDQEKLWVSFIDWNFKDTVLHMGLRDKAKSEFKIGIVTEKNGPGWTSKLLKFPEGIKLLYSVNRTKQIHLSHLGPEGWVTENPLVPYALSFDAAVRPDGELVIVYEDISTAYNEPSPLRLLRKKGKTVKLTTIDQYGPEGDHISIAISPKGKLLVAYHSIQNLGLKIYEED